MEGVLFMTKVDIYSGFLGAGKTTLIKKMIAEGYKGQKLVLIENEFGDVLLRHFRHPDWKVPHPKE